MSDDLNWNSFSKCYHLKNEKYVNDVALLRRVRRDTSYPVLLFPKRLNEQLSKNFTTDSAGISVGDKKHVYLHDFFRSR